MENKQQKETLTTIGTSLGAYIGYKAERAAGRDGYPGIAFGGLAGRMLAIWLGNAIDKRTTKTTLTHDR